MHGDSASLYPNCPTITRTVQVGGLLKSELLEQLQRNAIALNEPADRLFASEYFTTTSSRYSTMTVELTVRDLGFPHGATIAEIYNKAGALGLSLCPLELGPHLRLQYLDQPEGYWGQPVRQHQAPSGSITIASEPPSVDNEFPKGFYLRRIKGVLWLRGYRSSPEHIWEPDDHFIFRQTERRHGHTTCKSGNCP
ncbi:MAG: hypothetical protein MUD01_02300 [Chloroflexaceae bacterium]|jgi:hypothetical protein|nr:hypothetical protein [Chloroflexaceae bacterium]